MKVVLVGATGNLGTQINSFFTKKGYEIKIISAHELLDNSGDACEEVKLFDPEVIINAAAYNDVDGAENPNNKKIAEKLNTELPKILAETASNAKAKFVHFSSDYVFDGTKEIGYVEDDVPNPLSIYGETKLAGEIAAKKNCEDLYICRVSKLFGPAGSSIYSKPDFVSLMIKLAKTQSAVSIVDDELATPTYTKDVAEALPKLLDYKPGIYHVVSGGEPVTWYGFSAEIWDIAHITTDRIPVSSEAFARVAVRPKYSALKSRKFPLLRSRTEALKEYLNN